MYSCTLPVAFLGAPLVPLLDPQAGGMGEDRRGSEAPRWLGCTVLTAGSKVGLTECFRRVS